MLPQQQKDPTFHLHSRSSSNTPYLHTAYTRRSQVKSPLPIRPSKTKVTCCSTLSRWSLVTASLAQPVECNVCHCDRYHLPKILGRVILRMPRTFSGLQIVSAYLQQTSKLFFFTTNLIIQEHSLPSAHPLFGTTDSIELGYPLHLFRQYLLSIIHHGCNSKLDCCCGHRRNS